MITLHKSSNETESEYKLRILNGKETGQLDIS